MAFNRHGLSVLAYANHFTLWHYRTEDSAADVETMGYFNSAAEMMHQGDMILANVDIVKTPVGARIYQVWFPYQGVVCAAHVQMSRT